MRTLAITAASLMMMTLPARAQNATNPQAQQNPATSAPQAQQNPSMNSPEAQNSQAQTQNSKRCRRSRSRSKQSGASRIQGYRDSSFIVRARDQNDNPVMMVISSGRLRERARNLPPGTEQTTLWLKVRQAETAFRIDAWLSSSEGLPPNDV
jgi:hypothetical protein